MTCSPARSGPGFCPECRPALTPAGAPGLVGAVAADPLQLELCYFPQEPLDAAMFLYGCLHLLREVFGDEYGPGFSGVFEGHVRAAAGLPSQTCRQGRVSLPNIPYFFRNKHL
jgi:hypothetical protein